MRHTRTWLFVFLPVLYLAIILGLVAVQFSKKSDTFSQSLGDLTISGKTSAGGEPAALVLKGRGLVFSFDSTRVLQAEASDGTVARLRPLSWEWKEGNVFVTFQNGFRLLFEKSDGGRSLLIRPIPDEASKQYTLVRIPFSPDGGTQLVHSPRGYLVEVSRGSTPMVASVDGARDRIDIDHTFVLTLGKNGFRPARLDPLVPKTSVDLAWLTIDNAADRAKAETVLAQYWEKAYVGWNGASTFSTKLVDAWSREALQRGDYPAAFAKIQNLLNRDRKDWGFEALPYLGNMVELTVQQRRAIETLSSRSQPDWSGQGHLWLDAGYYGPTGSADRVKRLLLTGPLPDAVTGLTAVLQNLITLQANQPSEAVTARIQEVLTVLQKKTIRREGDLFVQGGEGLLDLRSGLVLGRLWLDHARALGNELYSSAGAQLIVSALSYLDTQGRLPEILVSQDGKIVRQEGWVLPEEIYNVVRPALEAETPIAEWGSGAFLRTASAVVSQKVTAASALFAFRFPAGSAEHVVISGVPAFDHITLHGIRWRTDPQFQSYTDGWYYSASTQTLYVKIKHREDLEELMIHFHPEE